MPSTSEKQAKTMTAACKNAKFRKKVGIPKDVACDFHKADKGKYHEELDMDEMNRLTKLAGMSNGAKIVDITEKFDAPKTEQSDDDTNAQDIPRLMHMAGIKKRLEDDKEEGDEIADISGVYSGVARGEIKVGDKGRIGEAAFDFIKNLIVEGEDESEEVDESDDVEEVDEARQAGKTEHSGAKKGKGAYYGRKADAKKDSNKQRRGADKNAVRNDESSMFKKDTIERIIVEMIVERIAEGKTVRMIAEDLSVHEDDVRYIHDWVVNRKKS
jgi:hypothetical protein